MTGEPLKTVSTARGGSLPPTPNTGHNASVPSHGLAMHWLLRMAAYGHGGARRASNEIGNLIYCCASLHRHVYLQRFIVV